jgi:hypothetical protein
MTPTLSTFQNAFLLVGVALSLCSCFGAGQYKVVAEFEEIQITPDEFGPIIGSDPLVGWPVLETSDDVLVLLGPPLLKSQEGDSEVWSYKLSGLITETHSGVWVAYVVMIPVWSTTKYDVNTKFYFRNSALEKVMVLRSHYSKDEGCLTTFFPPMGACGAIPERPPAAPQTSP